MDRDRLEALRLFADTALRQAKDPYRGTPLFADGIDVLSGQPAIWPFPLPPGACPSVVVRAGADASAKDRAETVPSNFSCQQNFLRVLDGLSALTGDEGYRDAAKSAIAYMFENYQDASGLLRWGGHQCVNLRTGEVFGYAPPGVHELKDVFPHYELMFETKSAESAAFVRGFWEAHVYDWKSLEIGRHGAYGPAPSGAAQLGDTGNGQARSGAAPRRAFLNLASFEETQPFFEAKGLSFLNAGDDLIYAAAALARHADRDDPAQAEEARAALLWMSRLVDRYASARDPNTRLGAFQFTQPKKTAEAPGDRETLSWYGDRAQRQMGPELETASADPDPRHRRVLEAKILFQHQAVSIYSTNALMQAQIGLELGAGGKRLLALVAEGLIAFHEYAYDSASANFKPMLCDGTDLSGFVLARDGYYGAKGFILKPYPAAPFLASYARAYRACPDPRLWAAARDIGIGIGLGDLGAAPGRKIALREDSTRESALRADTGRDEAAKLFAILDIFAIAPAEEYLDLARAIGDSMCRRHFVRTKRGNGEGYFLPEPDAAFARIDAIEPQALLALEAAIQGRPGAVAPYLGGSGFMDIPYRFTDGSARNLKSGAFFAQKRGERL